MAFSVETVNQLLASGRNYVSVVVGFVGGVGVISAAQSKGLTDAFTEIYNGLSMVFHGATSIWQILIVAFPFIAVWMAKIASKSASVPNQAAQVKAAVADPATPITTETKAVIVSAAQEVVKQ